MAWEINIFMDNCIVRIDNGLDAPAVTFQLSSENISQTVVLSEQVSEYEDTSVKWDAMEQIMANYKMVMKMYEWTMTENYKLNKKLQHVEKN